MSWPLLVAAGVLALYAGFVVTLNTDNRTLIGCSMSSELDLARRCGATDAEIEQMRGHALAALFPTSA